VQIDKDIVWCSCHHVTTERVATTAAANATSTVSATPTVTTQNAYNGTNDNIDSGSTLQHKSNTSTCPN
jgi:hypothetical protein